MDGGFWTDVLKPILEVGAIGSMAVVMFFIFRDKDKKLEESHKERIQCEKDHGKELLRKEIEKNSAIGEVIKSYEATASALHMAIEELTKTLALDAQGGQDDEPRQGERGRGEGGD